MAASLRDYYNTGYDDYGGVYGASWKAQSYLTTSAYSATSLKLRVYRIGDLTGRTFTASLKAVDGLGKPTGDDLAVGTYDPSALTTEDVNGAVVEITFSTPYVVSDATTYAIVCRLDGGDSTNAVRWKVDSSTGYANGNNIYSSDSGASWTVGAADYDQMFEVWGNDTITAYDLVCETGAFTLTGKDAFFDKTLNLICQTGAFVLTGISVLLERTGLAWFNQAKSTSISPTNSTKNSISPTNSSKNNISPTNQTKS